VSGRVADKASEAKHYGNLGNVYNLQKRHSEAAPRRKLLDSFHVLVIIHHNDNSNE